MYIEQVFTKQPYADQVLYIVVLLFYSRAAWQQENAVNLLYDES